MLIFRSGWGGEVEGGEGWWVRKSWKSLDGWVFLMRSVRWKCVGVEVMGEGGWLKEGGEKRIEKGSWSGVVVVILKVGRGGKIIMMIDI